MTAAVDTPSADWHVGQIVEVASRTWAGINRPGGTGRITAVHANADGQVESLDVKYLVNQGYDNFLALDLVQPAHKLDRRDRSRKPRTFLTPTVPEPNKGTPPNATAKSKRADNDKENDKQRGKKNCNEHDVDVKGPKPAKGRASKVVQKTAKNLASDTLKAGAKSAEAKKRNTAAKRAGNKKNPKSSEPARKAVPERLQFQNSMSREEAIPESITILPGDLVDVSPFPSPESSGVEGCRKHRIERKRQRDPEPIIGAPDQIHDVDDEDLHKLPNEKVHLGTKHSKMAVPSDLSVETPPKVKTGAMVERGVLIEREAREEEALLPKSRTAVKQTVPPSMNGGRQSLREESGKQTLHATVVPNRFECDIQESEKKICAAKKPASKKLFSGSPDEKSSPADTNRPRSTGKLYQVYQKDVQQAKEFYSEVVERVVPSGPCRKEKSSGETRFKLFSTTLSQSLASDEKIEAGQILHTVNDVMSRNKNVNNHDLHLFTESEVEEYVNRLVDEDKCFKDEDGNVYRT